MAAPSAFSFLLCFALVISASANPGTSPLGYLRSRRSTNPHSGHKHIFRALAKRAPSDCSGVCAPIDEIQRQGLDIDIHCTNDYTQYIYACHLCRYPDVTTERMQKVLDDWVDMCTEQAKPLERVIVPPRTSSGTTSTTATSRATSSTPPPTSAPTSSTLPPTTSTSSPSTLTPSTAGQESTPTSQPTGTGYPDTAGPPADPKLEALLGAGPLSDEKQGAATNSASRGSHRWPDSTGFTLGRYEIGLKWSLFVGLWTFLCNACL